MRIKKIYSEISRHCDEELTRCTSLDDFTAWMRSSDLAFLPCDEELSAPDCFALCYELLYEIGRTSSIPFGIAACMHLYMLASIAKFPISDPVLLAKRAGFLAMVREGKLLIANSGSDPATRSNGAKTSATRAERIDGRITVTGAKSFVTLATHADLLIFTAADPVNNRLLSLFTPLKENPGIRLGELSFGAFLTQTGTRSISFEKLLLDDSHVVSEGVNDGGFALAHLYQRSWFQGLVGAVYLGALSRSMEHAVDFARTVPVQPSSMLVDADGFILDIGRLQIKLQAARQLRFGVQNALSQIADEPANETAYANAANMAGTAKYMSTQTAEECSPMVRKLVGLRSFDPQSPVGKFCTEVMFAQLHPELAPLFERAQGRIMIESLHAQN